VKKLVAARDGQATKDWFESMLATPAGLDVPKLQI
jgi:hypothetical protein